MRSALAIVVSLGPLLTSAEVFATPRDPAAAEALFEAGREMLDAGNFEGACEKFAESQRLDPGAGTLMNWATCEEKLGKTASAWQHFREAADALAPTDERAPFARQKIKELEERLPWLTLRLDASAPPNVLVLRDGVPLETASLGMALPIDPGQHTIVVRAPEHADQRYDISLEEGEQKALVLQPGKPIPRVSPVPSKKPVLGWTLIGAGTASIGVGVATAFMLEREQDLVDEHCTNNRCDDAGVEAAARGKRLVWINALTLGAGAAALGTGVVLVVTSNGAEKPGTTKVSAEIVRGGAFVGYGGSF